MAEEKKDVEQALADSLKELVQKMPFEKITIKKITDGAGNLLYKDASGSPAVYGVLENIGATGAFNVLNVSGTPALYTLDGTQYTGGEYQIQMLVPSYDLGSGMQMKMVDSKAIVEGLGYYCGKLEEREAFVGLGVMDTLTPYDIFLEINGQMFRVINADTEFPGSEGIEMRKMPEGNGTETFKVYENRNKGFYQIGEVEVPTDNVQDFLKKPVWVGLGVNKDRELSLVIQNMATEAYLEFPVGPAQAQGATAGSGDDITEFIEKILPIIDNLEYASKFAQDEDNPYTKGIIQTYENAVKILEENGITIISGEGEPFDFNYQNAVAHVTDVDLPENTVKQVMQTGYVYKGKVIRTASVIVAN